MALEIITRAQARAQGFKRFYSGRPCKRGHLAERFTTNNYCTDCARLSQTGYKPGEVSPKQLAGEARAAAKAADLIRYSTGEPCKNGHIAERLVNGGNCIECLRLRQAANYHADPEKHRQASKASRAKNRDGHLARRREKYASDPAPHRERAKRYSAENPEKVKSARKARYQADPEGARREAAEYRAKNIDKARESQRKAAARPEAKERQRLWKQENRERLRDLEKLRREKDPDRFRKRYRDWVDRDPERASRIHTALAHKRRCRIIEAGGSHTAADLRAILVAQGYSCAYCAANLKRAKRHLDHIMPLALGGSNDRSNLQFTCPPCNLAKGAKHPVDFAQSLGLLI